MNSTWSRRSRWYSCSIGSLTLSSSSAAAHTSSAVPTMRAPAASKSASVIELPTPAAALDEHVVAGAGELVRARPG